MLRYRNVTKDVNRNWLKGDLKKIRCVQEVKTNQSLDIFYGWDALNMQCIRWDAIMNELSFNFFLKASTTWVCYVEHHVWVSGGERKESNKFQSQEILYSTEWRIGSSVLIQCQCQMSVKWYELFTFLFTQGEDKRWKHLCLRSRVWQRELDLL